MRFILLFFLLLSNVVSAQTGRELFFSLSGQGATGPQVSSVNVKYRSTDYSYITSKAGYSDTGGPFATGSNVINVCSTSGTNSGLSYDPYTDRFLINESQVYFFTREAYTTAANGSIPTDPAHDEEITFSGSIGQGVSLDPINREFYVQAVSDDEFTRRDYSGSILETIDYSGLGRPLSFNTYDYGSKTVYLSGDGELVYGYKKVNGTWTLTFTSFYGSNEGTCIDYLTGSKMVYNGSVSSQNPTGTIREQHYKNGENIVEYPYPMTSMSGVVEGFAVDQADGSFWINSDQSTHGGITNGNRLWHTDPRGWYKKYYRSPHMDRFSEAWKTNGNVITGVFGSEAIKGPNFSIGPVIDYGAFTGQQTLGNWTFGDGENAVIEFRGSSSAPTTTAETTREYHDLVVYSANGSNDGWGSTSPGSWQSTPTTDRYMQVRVKPQAPAISTDWTPLDLGDTLVAWFTGEQTTKWGLSNQYQNAGTRYWDADGNEVSAVYNKVSPSDARFLNSSLYPLWNNTNHYWEMTAGNRHFAFTPYADWETILADGDFEINVVGQRSGTSTRAIFFSFSNTGSNNNQFSLQHNSTGNTPASYLCVQWIDNSGTVVRHGVTDTGSGTNRLLSFQLGVTTNKIFINKVQQTLTDNSGTNTGQSFENIVGLSNTLRVGRTQASSSVTGTQRVGDVFITRHLSVWARAKLYTYLQGIGQLP